MKRYFTTLSCSYVPYSRKFSRFSRLTGKARKLNLRNKSLNAHSRHSLLGTSIHENYIAKSLHTVCPRKLDPSKISGYTVYDCDHTLATPTRRMNLARKMTRTRRKTKKMRRRLRLNHLQRNNRSVKFACS